MTVSILQLSVFKCTLALRLFSILIANAINSDKDTHTSKSHVGFSMTFKSEPKEWKLEMPLSEYHHLLDVLHFLCKWSPTPCSGGQSPPPQNPCLALTLHSPQERMNVRVRAYHSTITTLLEQALDADMVRSSLEHHPLILIG